MQSFYTLAPLCLLALTCNMPNMPMHCASLLPVPVAVLLVPVTRYSIPYSFPKSDSYSHSPHRIAAFTHFPIFFSIAVTNSIGIPLLAVIIIVIIISIDCVKRSV